MTTIVMATGNKHKVAEMRELLAPYMGNEYRLVSMKEAGFDGDIEENGKTFAENAYIKASTVCKATGEITIADDSGLCVDALGGAPGIFSARYAPPGSRKATLLKELGDTPHEQRTARFVASICCYLPNGDTIVADGVCEGFIAFTCRGDSGFGYDPIFELPCGKTFAEIPSAEKDEQSHRGLALKAFAARLNDYVKSHEE